MFIRSPLPFVTEFVDELNNALAQHQPGTRLSKLQCLWVSFCLTGILMTNTVCWAQFERARRTAGSFTGCCHARFWDLLQRW